MPCRTDYMHPSQREAESKLVASHLCYLFAAMKRDIAPEILKAKDACYGNLSEVDNWTALLCSTISNMSTEEQDKYVYDGRNPQARALADWWGKHQARDKQRELEEQKIEQRNTQAFLKLPLSEQQRLLNLAKAKILSDYDNSPGPEYEWCGICSTHKERNDNCKRCRAGMWIYKS